MIILLLFTASSCQFFDDDVPQRISFEKDILNSNLDAIIKDTAFLNSFPKIKKEFREKTLNVYSENNLQLFWVKDIDDTTDVETVLLYFKNAEHHGLSKERYYYNYLSKQYLSLWKNSDKTLKPNYHELVKFDVILSLSFIQYQNDIINGVINPRLHDPENYDIPLPSRPLNAIKNLLASNRVETLEIIQPKDKRYTGLQNALKFYSEFAESGNWASIPFVDGKIELGAKSTVLATISQNLKSLGLLDTAYHLSFPPAYDSVLFNSVKKYQRLYGLKDDGVIGKQTLEQLSTSPAERVEQIAVNLERLRWTTYRDSLNYVLVNIPDFNLYAYKEGKLETTIKVCVGKKREKNYDKKLAVYKQTKKWIHLPKNFETPQVYSRIFLIVTNPKWNVPSSIAKNETYYEAIKDSNYLSDKKFKVFMNGELVDHSSIDWKKYSPSTLPFAFVQDPGWANALGKIKFMFYNKYAIYLHDTPTRAPFSASDRAVSHGCIRVEKPLQLAQFITDLTKNVTLDDIKIELNIKPDNKEKMDKYISRINSFGGNPKTKELNLDRSIPVYVDYITAWVDDYDKLQFRLDVYEKDKILSEALKSQER